MGHEDEAWSRRDWAPGSVPISQAIAASSAIPGFFEPYTIGERDFVDGGVGYTGHADLAVERGGRRRGRGQSGRPADAKGAVFIRRFAARATSQRASA